MASRLSKEDKNKEKLLRLLRDRKVSELTSEAQRYGIQVTILASMDPAVTNQRHSFIAGNMPPHRLMTLVGEMTSDKKLDISPLTLPSMKLPFDQLSMNRVALRKVNYIGIE